MKVNTTSSQGNSERGLPAINLQNYQELTQGEVLILRNSAVESIKYTGIDLKYDWQSLDAFSSYIEANRNVSAKKREEIATKTSSYLAVWLMEVFGGKAVKAIISNDGLKYVLLNGCLFAGAKRNVEMAFEYPELTIYTQIEIVEGGMMGCEKTRQAAKGIELIEKVTGTKVSFDIGGFESIRKAMDLLRKSGEIPSDAKDTIGAFLGEMLLDHRHGLWNKYGRIIGRNFLINPSELVERYLSGKVDIFWKEFEPLEQSIQQQSEEGRSFIALALNMPVGYDEEGVKALGVVLTQMQKRKSKADFMLEPMAMFLGNCIIAKYGGEWTNELAVFVKPTTFFDPQSMVSKQYLYGKSEDVFQKYICIPATVSAMEEMQRKGPDESYQIGEKISFNINKQGVPEKIKKSK